MRGRRWRWRCRRRGKGRPPAPVYLSSLPPPRRFEPTPGGGEPIVITYPEVEAARLVDYEGLSYEEAAAVMGVSRGTVWRLVQSARRKLIEALLEGRPIVVEPGGEVEEVNGEYS